jgi:EmrB/QacA subfamily drug resistance transporter
MTESQKWLALAFLVLAQFMIVLDVSIMNVALPSIQKDFDLTVTDLQSIVTAYTLAFGGLLLFGGRAADLYGRRFIFLCGVIAFTTVSLLIGIADSAALMVPLRALQGIGAAFMSPAALSIVLTMFRDPAERTRALSIWGAVSAGGATVGLLLGGLLTTYLNWRWNFFVNVPVGILVTIAALWLVPKHEAEESDRTLDLPGAVLATSGLMLLVYTLSHGQAWGWQSTTTLGALALSLILLIGFVINEIYIAKHPLVPFSIFRLGNVAAADLVQLPVTASLFSMFFFISLYVQEIMKYTPLNAGLAFLPVSILIGMGALLAPRLIARLGYKPIIVVAPLLIALGLFTFAHIEVGGSYMDILPGLLLAAAGLGFSFVSISVAATTGVPPQESGLASGLLTTAQQIGGSLGLAVLTSVATAKTMELAASGTSRAQAVVEGFHAAFYTGVGFAIAASLIALFFIRRPRTRSERAGFEGLPVAH